MTPRPAAPALTATEAAPVAVFDAPQMPPEVVETVARAMHEVPGQPGVYGRIPWDRLMEQHRDAYRQMAAAAIAALPPSPAEEAVERVEELAEEYRIFGMVLHDVKQAELFADVAKELRAVLASPAVAPQGEEAGR